jgi:hypothetical protein
VSTKIAFIVTSSCWTIATDLGALAGGDDPGFVVRLEVARDAWMETTGQRCEVGFPLACASQIEIDAFSDAVGHRSALPPRGFAEPFVI